MRNGSSGVAQQLLCGEFVMVMAVVGIVASMVSVGEFEQ